MNLISPYSSKLEQSALWGLLHNCNIVKFIQCTIRGFKFTHLIIPDTDSALSEISDWYQELIGVVEFHSLDSSRVELELFLNGKVQS